MRLKPTGWHIRLKTAGKQGLKKGEGAWKLKLTRGHGRLEIAWKYKG